MDSEEQIRDELFPSETSAVLLGILIPPLLILWISSLYLVRREDDPARMAFMYMKIVFPMALLALTLRFIHVMAMNKILVSHVSDETPLDEFLHCMVHVINRLDALSATLLDVTDVFLIITLFELGNGFLIYLTAKRSSFYLVVRARDKPLIFDSTMIFLGVTVLNLLNPGRQLLMIILDLNQDGRNIAREYFYLIDNILDHWA
uniref:Uncharacterized protein n=1 Tax=Fusarium oxysporum (strain Fo5176) TaxID=660025 RepID=A0A0D2YFF2_FUSOF